MFPSWFFLWLAHCSLCSCCELYLSLTLFLLNLVFPRPSLLRGSVSPCRHQSASFGGRRGHSCFLSAPWGRSMQWCLLLIWAQGLRQAPLPASGKIWSLAQDRTGGRAGGKGRLEPRPHPSDGRKYSFQSPVSPRGRKRCLWEGAPVLFSVAGEGLGIVGCLPGWPKKRSRRWEKD